MKVQISSRNWRRAAAIIAAGLGLWALPLATPVLAQTSMAAINGTVTDASGAVIPGAKVTATNQQQNTGFTTTANAAGIYNLPRVPTGRYTIQATSQGFQTAKQGPFNLILDQTAQINFKLTVGQATQTVQVTGQAPLLQTETTTTSTNLNAESTSSLPMISRNYVQLAQLTPGAVVTNPGSGSTMPFINGNRQQANNFLLGGVDNNQTTENAQGYTPTADAIQEFNLISSNASAEYGNFQGGIISVDIKSGTNQWHGNAWEYVQNDKLNANSWSNNWNTVAGAWTPLPRGKVRWNDFGGTIGGPILKDKLFIFGDYDGNRNDTPTSASTATVMTAAERGGDFGAVCTLAGGTFNAGGVCSKQAGQIYMPSNGVAAGARPLVPFNNFANTSAGNAYGYVGPVATQNVVAQKLFASPALYPLPLNAGLQQNYTAFGRSYTNTNQGDVRADYNLNSTNRVTWRGSMLRQNGQTLSTMPLFLPTTNTARDWNSVLGWTHSIGGGFVNDAKIGLNYVGSNGAVGDNGLGNIAQNIGIQQGNSRGPGLMGLVFMNGGASNLGNANTIGLRGVTVITYEDQMILTQGRHLIHTGFVGMRYRENYFYGGNNGLYGQMQFGGKFTAGVSGTGSAIGGSDIADFWLGLVDQAGRGPGTGVFGQRRNVFGTYVQDDWRATSALTLNLGLRYQNFRPIYEKYDREVNVTPFGGILMQAGTAAAKAYYGDGRGLYRPTNGLADFQPRLGFAWSALNNTVVSGAFGTSTYMEGTGLNLRPTINPPYGAEYLENNEGLTYPTTTADQGLTQLSVPGDPFAGATLRLWDADLKPAVTEQWSLNIQRQLSNDTTLQIGYLGQHATHLVTAVQLLDKVMPVDCRHAGGSTILGAPCNAADAAGPVISPYLYGSRAAVTSLAATDPSYNLGGRIKNISGTLTDGISIYHSLQAVLKRHFSNGLQFQGSYTFSKCLTDSGGFYGAGGSQSSSGGGVYAQDTFNQRLDYGPCFQDTAHAISAYAVYQLPFGSNKAYDLGTVGNHLLGNWQLSPTWLWHTGFAFSPTGTRGVADGDAYGSRASCNGPVQYTQSQNALGGFNFFSNANGAFSNPVAGQFATCGRGVMRGPGLDVMNLSLTRSFPITEAKSLQIRADFNNLTNTPEFSVPNANFNSSSFMRVSGAQGQRTVMLALKFYY